MAKCCIRCYCIEQWWQKEKVVLRIFSLGGPCCLQLVQTSSTYSPDQGSRAQEPSHALCCDRRGS